MTELQKIIKYLAIALAIGLSVAIIVGAVSLLGMIFGFTEDDDMVLENYVEYEIAQDVTRLDIDVSAAELKIVEGDRLFVSSNIKDLRVSDAGGSLTIEQKRRRFSIHTTKVGEIIITIPTDKSFEAIELSAGAGDVDIYSLTADRMSLEFGAGLFGNYGQCAYAAAKEGIRGLSRTAATEWSKDGINVNVICPLAWTSQLENFKNAYPDAFEKNVHTPPMGRFGDPETDIGRVCVQLAHPDFKYMTGETLTVEGGLGLRP